MSESQRMLVTLVVALSFYSLGASFVERFVNYATWSKIPGAGFREYHRAQRTRIASVIVVPLGVSSLCQVLLMLVRPANVPSWITWGLLASSLVGVLSTVTLQLPIHVFLDRNGYSAAHVERLLQTDWIRKATDVSRTVCTLALLNQMLSPARAVV